MILILLTFLTTTTIFGATFLSVGSKSPSITIQNYSGKYEYKWVNAIDASLSAWNNTSTKISITKSSSSPNNIVVANYGQNNTWYGKTTIRQTSGNYITAFDISINSFRVDLHATNFNNFSKSVIVHEFGHVFWLADNPSTGNASIMNYNRNRNTLCTPTGNDVKNINSKYK